MVGVCRSGQVVEAYRNRQVVEVCRSRQVTDFVVVVNQPPREVQVGSRSGLESSEAGDRFGFERDQQFPLASPEVQTVPVKVSQSKSISDEELKTVLLNGYDNSFSRILYYQSLLFSLYLIAWVFTL